MKIRFIAPQGVNGHRRPVPDASQQRYAMGELEPGKVQGRGHVGITKGSCDYRACRVISRGKLVLSRNLGYKTRGSPCG